tara:strand:- start:1136 stop:1687 length:552 start_codon:yes stop_codon:yes gene_type:complete
MSGLEVNKIIAAIVMAVLIIFIISNIGDILVNTDSDKNAKTAFKIEESEANTDDTAKTIDNELTEIEPISALLASASIEKGEKIYKKCGACHTYKKDGASKMGPNLWNIINRTKANVDGFAYSKALSEFGGKWTYEEMSKFLYKPKDYIKGTKMNFSGLKKVEDRANLVLFLREQADNPVSLP